MNDILSRANKLVKQKRPIIKTEKLYSLWQRENFAHISVQSSGCKKDFGGSCIMCDYTRGVNLSKSETETAIRSAASEVENNVNTLLIGTSGSLFDKSEIPEENLDIILDVVADIPAETIIIETHYQTINDDVLKCLSRKLEKKDLILEFGLESANENILNNCINKDIDLLELQKAIKLVHSYNMQVTLNILIGAPFLTVQSQIEDSLNSIAWAFKNKADFVVLFPVNIKPFTLLEFLYENKMYDRLSNWVLVEVLRKVKKNSLGNISLSWYGNRSTFYKKLSLSSIPPKDCHLCHAKLEEFFEAYMATRDSKLRNHLLEHVDDGIKCDCHKLVLNSLSEKNNYDIQESISAGHNYIISTLLKEDNE